MLAGGHAHGAEVGENPLLPADDVLVKVRRGQVPVDFLDVPNAVVFKSHLVFQAFLRHDDSLIWKDIRRI
jgi:hypothetical protein